MNILFFSWNPSQSFATSQIESCCLFHDSQKKSSILMGKWWYSVALCQINPENISLSKAYARCAVKVRTKEFSFNKNSSMRKKRERQTVAGPAQSAVAGLKTLLTHNSSTCVYGFQDVMTKACRGFSRILSCLANNKASQSRSITYIFFHLAELKRFRAFAAAVCARFSTLLRMLLMTTIPSAVLCLFHSHT